jgi:hypothetical protein
LGNKGQERVEGHHKDRKTVAERQQEGKGEKASTMKGHSRASGPVLQDRLHDAIGEKRTRNLHDTRRERVGYGTLLEK